MFDELNLKSIAKVFADYLSIQPSNIYSNSFLNFNSLPYDLRKFLFTLQMINESIERKNLIITDNIIIYGKFLMIDKFCLALLLS